MCKGSAQLVESALIFIPKTPDCPAEALWERTTLLWLEHSENPLICGGKLHELSRETVLKAVWVSSGQNEREMIICIIFLGCCTLTYNEKANIKTNKS